MENERLKGKIKFWNVERGFGFVEGEDNKEYFCHQTEIKYPIDVSDNVLYEGEKITFLPTQTDKGLSALEIKRE